MAESHIHERSCSHVEDQSLVREDHMARPYMDQDKLQAMMTVSTPKCAIRKSKLPYQRGDVKLHQAMM
jgi:hypothetical protein